MNVSVKSYLMSGCHVFSTFFWYVLWVSGSEGTFKKNGILSHSMCAQSSVHVIYGMCA